jgi:hypothetical protein
MKLAAVKRETASVESRNGKIGYPRSEANDGGGNRRLLTLDQKNEKADIALSRQHEEKRGSASRMQRPCIHRILHGVTIDRFSVVTFAKDPLKSSEA